METLFALIVILLATGGLAVGLALTGRPPTTCGGLSCGGRCAVCPRRKDDADG